MRPVGVAALLLLRAAAGVGPAAAFLAAPRASKGGGAAGAAAATAPATVRPAFFHAGEYEAFADDGSDDVSGGGSRPQRDALAHNLRRTDPLIFLTQRAVQSFIDLLLSTRDPHTAKWIEDGFDCRGLERYHGTGAFNLTRWPTGEALLVDMLHRPEDVVVVSARRRGRGHGGWSKNNPYLEDRWVEFNLDINPPSIVSRILSVREQISAEWLVDLETMVTANEQILTSYRERVAKARSEECRDLPADAVPPADCLPATEVVGSGGGGTDGAYDRTFMILLDSTMEFATVNSSPIRKGSFDLLILLATQESVHRVLREYRRAGRKREVSFEWLRNFYVERVAAYFDGNQEYGRADDFLEELLLTPPAMKTVRHEVELIDPLRIAEDIIRIRSQVGREWKEKMKDVPTAHLELRRLLLQRQMGNAANPSPFAAVSSDQVPEVEGFQ